MITISRLLFVCLLTSMGIAVVTLMFLSNQLDIAHAMIKAAGRGGSAVAIGCDSVAIGGRGGDSEIKLRKE